MTVGLFPTFQTVRSVDQPLPWLYFVGNGLKHKLSEHREDMPRWLKPFNMILFIYHLFTKTMNAAEGFMYREDGIWFVRQDKKSNVFSLFWSQTTFSTDDLYYITAYSGIHIGTYGYSLLAFFIALLQSSSCTQVSTLLQKPFHLTRYSLCPSMERTARIFATS